MRPVFACALSLACCATLLSAQPPQRPTCDAPEHRQFDFWIGDWEVLDAEGKPQGTNRIESILDGCVLRESWEGAGGSVGHSFNTYDRTSGQWHQTWVDNGGSLLQLDGGLEEGAMVLRGTGVSRDGGDLLHSITWTPLDDGRVKQHWQMSRDGGETWTDAFVGFYGRSTGG
jgi:hypothetical protein